VSIIGVELLTWHINNNNKELNLIELFYVCLHLHACEMFLRYAVYLKELVLTVSPSNQVLHYETVQETSIRKFLLLHFS
jgi:hypothetical protein